MTFESCAEKILELSNEANVQPFFDKSSLTNVVKINPANQIGGKSTANN